MSVVFWILLFVVLLAIFGGALLAGLAWVAWFALVGIIIGALARLLVPNTAGFGLFGTILAGIAGSIIGGVIAHVADLGWMLEFVVSILAAAVIVALANGASGGTNTPARRY